MPEKNYQPTQPLSYLFEFGSDGKIHAVSFKGKLSEEDIGNLLDAAGRQTYGKAGEAIRSYLEGNHLEYSGFESKQTSLKHEKIMAWAEILLHSDDCKTIDAHIGGADHYFSIMDHQEWTRKGHCEGCYYAVRRSLSCNYFDPPYEYRVIGQTFIFDESNDGANYFTIRKKDGPSSFRNLYMFKGGAVLPPFGCTDLFALLRNIGHIYNARQAKDIAIK